MLLVYSIVFTFIHSRSNLVNFFITYLFILCVDMGMWCQGTQVEVRGQVLEVGSPLLLCGIEFGLSG